uniref:Zinc finger C2H2 LYAR-type domain-containing protein n=1 Tax=Peronospora matthiolae TaxID=2874970 RepID=A0AAV1T7V8_9STRA
MVFFVCEGCNETVKKNKVDMHASRCRNCWAVSCVDCSVVFEGNDYAAHTSCVSEAEKYEKSLFTGNTPKQQHNTKQTPQERWMEIVQSMTCPEDRRVQNVLTRVAGYDNVPRKKYKFVNFVENSLDLYSSKLVEKVWTMYETALAASAVGQDDASASGPVAQELDGKKRLAEAAHDDTVVKKRKTEGKKRLAEVARDDTVVKKGKTEGKKRLAEVARDDTVVKEGKTVNKKSMKWSDLVRGALKSAGGELELKTLVDQVLQQIRDKKLSMKSDKRLKKEVNAAIKESDKVVQVQVVRLKQ